LVTIDAARLKVSPILSLVHRLKLDMAFHLRPPGSGPDEKVEEEEDKMRPLRRAEGEGAREGMSRLERAFAYDTFPGC
jgi:hypothetical protein